MINSPMLSTKMLYSTKLWWWKTVANYCPTKFEGNTWWIGGLATLYIKLVLQKFSVLQVFSSLCILLY